MVHSGPLRDISVISVISDQYAVGGGGGGTQKVVRNHSSSMTTISPESCQEARQRGVVMECY